MSLQRACLLLLLGCSDTAAVGPDVAGDVHPVEVLAPDASPPDEQDAVSPDAGPEDVDAPDEGVVSVWAETGDLSGPRFFNAPWPSDARGPAAVADFPDPDGSTLLTQLRQVVATEGFARTASVHFRFSGALGALPPVASTLTAASPVQLVDVDASSPERGRRIPVELSFRAVAGPYWPSNLLTLTPVQGIPLRAKTRYAAVVLRAVGDAQGTVLRRLPPAQVDAEALAAAGLSASDVAALTTFTTGDSAARLLDFVAAARAHPLDVAQAPALTHEYPGYCVYEGQLTVPDYQEGEPPYAETGGAWPALPAPAPRRVASRLVLTVPRAAPAAAGFPTVVFIRTGGGGDVPLVDRGVHLVAHGSAPPGTGPAQEFAAVGFAGVSIDGPHGGLRNVTKGDEQFLVFNVLNPAALRDNIRQSALEIALLPDLLGALQVDTSGCSGAPAVTRFDVGRLAVAGHSMGATIAPLALAAEPRFRAAVLSGAGSSLEANVLYKRSPLEVRPLMEAALGHAARGIRLEPGDPVLGLIQWTGEVSDPPAYAGLSAAHVLMVQGIVDTYILPPISNPTVLALGLELGGAPGDGVEALAEFPTTVSLLSLVGRGAVALPASGNQPCHPGCAAGALRTAVVVHHAQDAVEDGHEVFFQRPEPKAQYRRFLQTFGAGQLPEVVAP